MLNDMVVGISDYYCHGRIDNVTMWIGPFGGKTKNPILFVSNTLDPITPIEK